MGKKTFDKRQVNVQRQSAPGPQGRSVKEAIMLTMTAAEELRRIWEKSHTTACQLEKQLAEIRAGMAALETVLAHYAPVDGGTPETTPSHGHIRTDRIASCGTHLAAFKEIAMLSGGIVRVAEASRLVHEAGMSQGKARSIASGIRHKLLASDEWEYVEPGTYRLLTFNDEAEATADEAEAVDDQADEETVVVA